MLTRHTRNGVTWVDLESPTRQELQSVVAEFDIDTRIEEEIITPTAYPLIVASEKYVYLILHFPTTDPRGGAKNQEIDFIVGKHFMITARYEVIDSIHNLQKVFEAEELLGLPDKHTNAEGLLERLLRHLYAALGEETEHVARMLERIEHDIYTGKERETVINLSKVSRVLLRFDTALTRHSDSLTSFLNELTSPSFFGKEFREHINHIEAERSHAAGLVSNYRAVTTELRRTNDSLLTTKQNAIVTRLTIMAFATFPLTVIAGIFGMNTVNMPFVESPWGFWIILGIMALTVLGFVSFFRFRKWL
ncbi:MAG: magnesium transporter [Parcubacteria bacterium C7867-007]|nr:MAG: magnesium transporter [Parcubacteria bacterium C7867-007]